MTKKQSDGCVVVITDHRDAHVPYVEKHLEVPLVTLDPQEILKGAGLTFRFNNSGSANVTYKNQELSNVLSVWYRKPQEIDPADIPVDEVYKEYAKTAMLRLFYLLYNAFKDAKWVSDYYDIVRASDKAWQLAVARKLGLLVPGTVITSDKKIAKDFIASYPRTVTKPLTTTHPAVKGKNTAFFTTLLDKGFVPDLSNLHLAPAIFQEAVEMVHDVRVIVIGDKVFAATVHAKASDPASRVYDYRIGHYEKGVVIKAAEDFPKNLAKLCVEHTRALGLSFGALDFGQDTNGRFWFFENNPNGQWAFVEQATGQPIGKALADLLQGRNS